MVESVKELERLNEDLEGSLPATQKDINYVLSVVEETERYFYAETGFLRDRIEELTKPKTSAKPKKKVRL